MEQVGVEFKSGESTSKVFDPRNGAFNFPAATVSAELSSVLRGAFFSSLLVRRYQLGPSFFQSRSKRVAVRGFVVDKSLYFSSKGAIVYKAFDQ